MKEIFPLCAKIFDPEQIMIKKDGAPNEGTREAMAFAKSIDVRDADKDHVIQQIRPGVVRRLKNGI
jgi:hypothetical protein